VSSSHCNLEHSYAAKRRSKYWYSRIFLLTFIKLPKLRISDQEGDFRSRTKYFNCLGFQGLKMLSNDVNVTRDVNCVNFDFTYLIILNLQLSSPLITSQQNQHKHRKKWSFAKCSNANRWSAIFWFIKMHLEELQTVLRLPKRTPEEIAEITSSNSSCR
jgi:hypothetical protein